jgi:hypothetical protein
MEVGTFVPVIVEATKFVFSEVGKWLDQVRKQSKDSLPESSQVIAPEGVPALTQQEFTQLAANPASLMSVIDAQMARTNVYEIESLIQQIQIHRRNLVDFEAAEAEFGALTPQHIKRGIEREASATFEKSVRLRGLLEQIYGRRIED